METIYYILFLYTSMFCRFYVNCSFLRISVAYFIKQIRVHGTIVVVCGIDCIDCFVENYIIFLYFI